MQSVGRPDRRIDMLERTLDWFRAHGVLDAALASPTLPPDG